MNLRVMHLVGPFDGVVLRSVLADTVEQALARATAYYGEFAAAQSYAVPATQVFVDAYIADDHGTWSIYQIRTLGDGKVYTRFVVGGASVSGLGGAT